MTDTFRSLRRPLQAAFVGVMDVALLNLANVLAFWLRFGGRPAYNWNAYLHLMPWETAIYLIVFYFYGLYHYAHKTSNEMKSAIVTAILLAGFLTMAVAYLIVNIGFPRSVFLLSMTLQFPLFGIWHMAHRSYMLRTAPARQVLAVGSPAEWDMLRVRAGQFLPRITLRYLTPDEAVEPAVFHGIDAVILGRVKKDLREKIFLAAMARNIPCLWSPDTYDVLVAGAQLTSLDDAPMFSLPSVRVKGGSRAFKRLADIVVAALGLVLASPVMGLIAAAIWFDSGRPVLYRQDRVTSGGRIFSLIKFRTMIPDAERHTGPVLAQTEDPRVTPIGRFLRASHLDELPQLWNILVGDMSLVGPRPERPIFVDQFKEEVPHYALRHLTPPGLTGLAQVLGDYDSPPEEKATYDWHYAKTWSWLKDVSIMIQTVIQLWRR
ncbi:sugar transferase family protein [Sulfobacillus acidophilus TPY]|uniref:Exopolysaccharide biosynthesis polyprenyl glycosylphosphotransferase n=1 Tax=Sulfobacillus acidophilus (strain ATCC 700253 / DSM 10332 / NAL) TaxID=679936 RepID=G8TSU9_SULAD|nr:sugar transferase family protein [Sulfobacillus acidophilus TPY]AEW05564.1 exopolysaccharide biosynthesis polyprenyl glycosylphosphotransferase [Sulfobacillus acidophilus DSM 10332]